MTITRQAVVVGYDGSPDSHRALAWAAETARCRSRSLHVVVATGELSWLSPHDRWLRLGWASDLKAEARGLVASYRAAEVTAEVREGKAVPAVLEVADEAELVVVGARGRSLLAGTLKGSVSQHVAHHAPCTVVVVRARP